MPRSFEERGPFVDLHLAKKVQVASAKERPQGPIKEPGRAAPPVVPEMVGSDHRRAQTAVSTFRC